MPYYPILHGDSMTDAIQNNYQISMGKTFFYALFFHILILILGVVGLPHMKTREFQAPQPISIEFAVIEEIVKVTKAPKDIDKPTPEALEKPVEKPPKADVPQPAPIVKAEVAPKEIKKEIKPVEKKITPPPPEIKLKKPKPPEPKKVKEVKKEEPKKEIEKEQAKEEENTNAFASILKNLSPEEAQPKKDSSQRGEISQTITADELSAVRQQLAGCWSLLPGARDADKLAVELRIKIFPDRTVKTVDIMDHARTKIDPFFRAAADNAIRAVRHPACSPLNLPPNKYDLWKDIILNFDPRGMF